MLLEELKDKRFELRPGSNLAPQSARAVHPDVVVAEDDGEFKVDLVNSYFPALAVRPDYVDLAADKSLPAEVRDQARKKVENAR